MMFINNVVSLLQKEQKKYLIFIFLLIILTTILETLSIASFYPLLDLIINSQESLNEHQIKKIYINFLAKYGINKDDIFKFTIIFVGIIYTLKICTLLFCNWHVSNFEFSLRYYLTKNFTNNI